MAAWMKGIIANAGVLPEIFAFLWNNKKWWLIPMVTLLLVCGMVLIIAAASGIGPFIYTLF